MARVYRICGRYTLKYDIHASHGDIALVRRRREYSEDVPDSILNAACIVKCGLSQAPSVLCDSLLLYCWATL